MRSTKTALAAILAAGLIGGGYLYAQPGEGDDLPEAAAALVPPGTVDFGFRLLDVFAPTYGWDYPDAEAYFRFDRSRLVFTTSGGWVMGVGQGELDQELRLRVIPRTQANYLKILLGQVDTTSGHCHLDVRIDDVQYTTDVLPRSFGYVDVVLASHGAGEGEYEIEISLRREPNTGVVSVGLLQFELYRTIRTFPSEFVVP